MNDNQIIINNLSKIYDNGFNALKKINLKVKNFEPDKELLMKNIKFKINSRNSISLSYEKNSLDFGEIINYLNQNNVKIEDISTEDGDLEDVFVQVTKH